MNDLEEHWRIDCARQIRIQDDGLRAALYKSLVVPNLAHLRGGNRVAWGQPGWYASTDEVAPAASASSPFPVPLECTSWHNLESDPASGLVHRFFHRRAWLQLPYRPGARGLSFDVPYVVMPQALDELRLRLFDVQQPHRVEASAAGFGRVVLTFDSATLEVCARLGRVDLDLSCRMVAIPALAFPGSDDRRRLSLAITAPRLFD